MVMRTPALALAFALLAACGSGERAGPAPANEVAGAAPPASNGTAPSVPAPPPPPARPAYTLAANGIAPGLRFNMRRADAISAATAAFGPPTGNEHNDECGGGPMDMTKFHGLWLEFADGRLVGWSLDQAQPALHTAGGLAVGAPRRALGSAQVDEEASVGPEFEVNGISGVLDEHGTRIASLWAGQICQFD